MQRFVAAATATPSDATLSALIASLDAGQCVALPTDTSYALAADALDDDAIARLLSAAGERSAGACLALVGGFEDIHHVAFHDGLARTLTEAFWPGPLALRLRARPWLPELVTGGHGHIDVWAPGHATTRALANHFGPLAAIVTGATSLDALADQRLPASCAIDAGTLPGGTPTLVDGAEGSVLREGPVDTAQVQAFGR